MGRSAILIALFACSAGMARAQRVDLQATFLPKATGVFKIGPETRLYVSESILNNDRVTRESLKRLVGGRSAAALPKGKEPMDSCILAGLIKDTALFRTLRLRFSAAI